MNIREIAKLNPCYCEINREERNYAAIFFAALCMPGNKEKFLAANGFTQPIGEEFGIYFEYAYLRDLWYNIKDENVKKDIIRQKLDSKGIDDILKLPLKEINQKFGVGGEASSEYLQFPGKWAIVKYDRNFPDKDDFLKICRFKWSFNIKPDIVIHLDKDTAICIEAKYESCEGCYPASDVEKEIFKKRGIKYVGQMELQNYMMEELLGIKTNFMFLVKKKEKSDTHQVISREEAFNSIDISCLPDFAKIMISNIS
jgi:hypothetical protein